MTTTTVDGNTLTLHAANKTWHQVVVGNCLEIMPQYLSLDPPWRADLIFADPPFNIGEAYDGYQDKMDVVSFERFTAQWLFYCEALLKPNGIFVINVPDKMVKSILRMDHPNGRLRLIDWCIWHYRFGQFGRTKFISSHTHILVFAHTQDDDYTWNVDDILVESLRSSQYGDVRTLDSETPSMRPPLDVWDIPRVVGNSKERIPNHPNQLPEKYLERVIKAYSNVGECVLDPFGGTGTTSAVAARLGRCSVTCEQSSQYCDDIVNRIIAVEGV